MLNAATKTHLENLFCCRNTHCSKPGVFLPVLHIHYRKYNRKSLVHCAAHVAAFQAHTIKHNIMAGPSLSLPQWRDIDDEDTIIACVANFDVPTAMNTGLEDTCIGKIEFDQKTNQFGIRYTT